MKEIKVLLKVIVLDLCELLAKFDALFKTEMSYYVNFITPEIQMN